MNNFQHTISTKSVKRKFSIKQKQHYCKAFEDSGLSQADFCQTNGISKSALYTWLVQFKNKKSSDFAAVTLENPQQVKREPSDKVEFNFELSNQIKLTFELTVTQLTSLIKELAYATSATR